MSCLQSEFVVFHVSSLLLISFVLERELEGAHTLDGEVIRNTE